MAGRESVQFDFVSRGADGLARDFTKTGEGATLAAKGARLLADSLEKQRRASDVSAGASLALAKADKILADAEHHLADGALEADFALKRQAEQAKKTAAETAAAGDSAGLAAGGFGALASPMGAVVGAGVALSPVLVTLGAGLGGLGIAAAGVIGPVLKASQSAQGLQGAWAKLDPAQRAAAGSLLTLKGEYHAFQSSLQPEILTAFSQAVQLGGHILHDIQPVAAATGKAFDGFLGQLGSTLQDPEWQQFWGFMAKTAPQDMRLVGNLFISLANDLPPLLEALQPVATAVLTTAGDLAKLAHVAEIIGPSIDGMGFAFAAAGAAGGKSAGKGGGLNIFQDAITALAGPQSTKWVTKQVNTFAEGIDLLASGAGGATPVIHGMAVVSAGAGASLKATAASVTALTDATSAGLSPLLAYSGALITTKDDAKSFADAMKKSHGEIGLNTAAQRNSFGAANTYIQDLITQAQKAHDAGKGTSAEIGMLEQALPALDKAKTHSRLYWQEVQTLKGWLDRLRAEKNIRETVIVSGSGSWTMHNPSNQSLPGGFPGGTGAAAGMLVRGGIPGRDSVLVNTMPGELIVPTPMVQAGAVDHLRGRIPGFAQGGIVGSYSGSPGGLGPWAQNDWNASIRSVTESIGNTMAHSFASLFAVPGGGGGSPSALQRAAAAMFPAYGWGPGQLGALIALWNRESGWRWNATNPGSGAYGIPQSLPASKMASAGPDWLTNPLTQIRWGESYIAGRYGSPAGAWAHESAFGWYRNGLDAVVRHPTVIGVGEAGPERVTVTPLGRQAAGGITIENLNITLPPGTDREHGRRIVDAIKKFEAGSGTGWRK